MEGGYNKKLSALAYICFHVGVRGGGGELGEELDVMGLKPAGSSTRPFFSSWGSAGGGDKGVNLQHVLRGHPDAYRLSLSLPGTKRLLPG